MTAKIYSHFLCNMYYIVVAFFSFFFGCHAGDKTASDASHHAKRKIATSIDTMMLSLCIWLDVAVATAAVAISTTTAILRILLSFRAMTSLYGYSILFVMPFYIYPLLHPFRHSVGSFTVCFQSAVQFQGYFMYNLYI